MYTGIWKDKCSVWSVPSRGTSDYRKLSRIASPGLLMGCIYSRPLKFSPTDALNRFLLAQLQFDSLTDKTSPKAIKSAFDKLPRGSHALDIAYDEAMKRINNQRAGFRHSAEP
jgi:hypothetical protein